MIEIAKEAAIKAGEIVLSFWGTKHSVERKGTADNISVEADKLSENKILEILQKNFPKHSYLSEEIGKIDNRSEYCWVIDPIDGTLSYFSGMPTYGISIGLLKENKPILGVLNFPSLKHLYWAKEGQGAYKDGKRIFVNKESKLEKIIVGSDFGWLGGRKEETNNYLLPIVDRVRYTPILGCTVAGLSYVAEGIYGGYIHTAYPWDFTAGVAIIEEAGGKVTDFQGQPVDWTKNWISVLATNGFVHDKILNLINK